MPCWSVEESKVAFLEKSTNLDLLTEALQKLGFDVWKDAQGLVLSGGSWVGRYNKATGKLELPASRTIDEVKRSYSKETVNLQAKKMGWKLEWSTNAAGNEVATVLKRRF